MSKEIQSVGQREHRVNVNGVVGLCLSSVGLVGLLITIVVVFSIPFEEYTGDGQRNVVIGFGNFMNYLLRVLTGIVGLSIFGCLSGSGAIVSLIGMSFEPRRFAIIGLCVGMAGIFVGLGLIAWRMAAWGLLT